MRKSNRQQRYSFVIIFGNDGIHRMPMSMSFANCNICKKNTTLNDEIWVFFSQLLFAIACPPADRKHSSYCSPCQYIPSTVCRLQIIIRAFAIIMNCSFWILIHFAIITCNSEYAFAKRKTITIFYGFKKEKISKREKNQKNQIIFLLIVIVVFIWNITDSLSNFRVPFRLECILMPQWSSWRFKWM